MSKASRAKATSPAPAGPAARIDHRRECNHAATASARRACRSARLGSKAGGAVTWQSWFEQIEARASRAGGIDDYFAFNGVAYSGTPIELSGGRPQERPEGDFAGLIRDGLKRNSVIFACERLRVKVFSQARFMWQELNDRRPGALVGGLNTRLNLLDHPWTGGTTNDLLARIRLHADFAGNAYVVRRPPSLGNPNGALRLLRPDWVTLLLGSDGAPAEDPNDVDVEVIGYAYWPGGIKSGRAPDVFFPDEVAHYAPMPDPAAHYRGMSWLNPVITELMADEAATQHKLQFFRNGATGGAVVLVDKDMDETAFRRWMSKMNAETRGLANAYKTWYVTGGVDVKTLSADLKQLDFKVTQGAGETRIAAAAGTPPILVGLSEGLNAGQYNIYGQAKRSYVDGEVRPDWGNLCGSLEAIVTPPADKRLWYDDRDIPYLREDQRDQAEIFAKVMAAISQGVNAGFEPDWVVKAAAAFDPLLLVGHHLGLYSVQLQPPGQGTMDGGPPAGPDGQPPPPGVNGALTGGPAKPPGPGAGQGMMNVNGAKPPQKALAATAGRKGT